MGELHVQGFGAVSVDDIFYVDRPVGAGKGRVMQRIGQHGGNVATALVAVAALGGRAGFIGWLSDSDDDPSLRDLAAHGVDISLAPRRGDARAISSVIIVSPDGERFIAYDDAVPQGTVDSLTDAVLGRAPVLLIDSYATHSVDVVARARGLGLAIVADIEWTTGADTEALMALADHLVVPRAFAQAATGTKDAATMLNALWSPQRIAVVLTDGAGGSFLRQRGDSVLWHLPAHRVTAVDTTGAGDCFHGAYALALAQGKTPLDCMLLAGAAAALSVTGQGGRAALPGHADCDALMASAGAPQPVAFGTANDGRERGDKDG